MCIAFIWLTIIGIDYVKNKHHYTLKIRDVRRHKDNTTTRLFSFFNLGLTIFNLCYYNTVDFTLKFNFILYDVWQHFMDIFSRWLFSYLIFPCPNTKKSWDFSFPMIFSTTSRSFYIIYPFISNTFSNYVRLWVHSSLTLLLFHHMPLGY